MQVPFLVEIRLPEVFTPDFAALIPAQRAFVSRQLKDKRLLSYSLAMDRSRLWAVVIARDSDEVELLLEQMPLYSYYNQFKIHPLAFSEHLARAVPEFSLN